MSVVPSAASKSLAGFVSSAFQGSDPFFQALKALCEPFDNMVINAIYSFNGTGERRLIADGTNPQRDIWVPIINNTNTDLRAEKRIGSSLQAHPTVHVILGDPPA